MSEFKRKAPNIRKEGQRWYACFDLVDGRMKRVRLSDDEAEARREYAELSRKFLAGDYEPPSPERRGHHRRSHTSTMDKSMKPKNAASFVWPIPLSAGPASLELPTANLSDSDLAILQLSLKQFGDMIDMLKKQGRAEL